jgi:hypothetical protein
MSQRIASQADGVDPGRVARRSAPLVDWRIAVV